MAKTEEMQALDPARGMDSVSRETTSLDLATTTQLREWSHPMLRSTPWAQEGDLEWEPRISSQVQANTTQELTMQRRT